MYFIFDRYRFLHYFINVLGNIKYETHYAKGKSLKRKRKDKEKKDTNS